jgi:hypothetical protein
MLLCYLDHVQDIGRSLFPPEEAHLQRYAKEARLPEAQGDAQSRATLAEVSRHALVNYIPTGDVLAADALVGLSQERWRQCHRGVPFPGGLASAAM